MLPREAIEVHQVTRWLDRAYEAAEQVMKSHADKGVRDVSVKMPDVPDDPDKLDVSKLEIHFTIEGTAEESTGCRISFPATVAGMVGFLTEVIRGEKEPESNRRGGQRKSRGGK